jgi:1-pyrroline-5-carboxylate dehydrogenase
MDAITTVPAPVNEPNLTYAPGSPERAELEAKLVELQASTTTLTATIGGEKVNGGGAEIPVVQPHNHQHVLGVLKNSTQKEAKAAVAAAGGGARRRTGVAGAQLRGPCLGDPEGR